MARVDWLRFSDHFDWLTPYLQSRGMTRPIRWVMGAVALSLGLIPIEATLVAADRREWPVMVVYWLSGIGGVVAGYVWLTRWPSRRQSLGLALAGSTTMACWALLQSAPLLSLLACASLVISGGYFALFHSPRYVLLNLLIACVVALTASSRLWMAGEFLHAVLSLWLVVALNIIGPSAVLMLIDAFGVDLPHADRDALTGLFNRRGLNDHVARSIERAGSNEYLRVAVVDLDDFKRVNDVHGHAAGDEALRAVADILRLSIGDAATAFRIGGEEFLIVDTAPTVDVPIYVEIVRARIAVLPTQVTASIGTAVAQLGQLDGQQIGRLISVADQAMYEAKRLGGNRIRHRPVSKLSDGP